MYVINERGILYTKKIYLYIFLIFVPNHSTDSGVFYDNNFNSFRVSIALL